MLKILALATMMMSTGGVVQSKITKVGDSIVYKIVDLNENVACYVIPRDHYNRSSSISCVKIERKGYSVDPRAPR